MIIQSAIIILIIIFGAMEIKARIAVYRNKISNNFHLNEKVMDEVVLAASNVYNDILEKNKIINGDKIDLAILISAINFLDENVLYNLTGADKNKILEIINYNFDDVKEINIKNESIKERINLYKNIRIRKQLKWDVDDLIVEMMNFSHVCQKIFFRLNEEKVNEIKEKHDNLVNLYYHNYPEDKSVKKMIKK